MYARVVANLILVVGVALSIVAILDGPTLLFGISDILIAIGLGIYLFSPNPSWTRSPHTVSAGLAVMVVSAFADGILTLVGLIGPVTSAMTYVIIVGGLVALIGLFPAKAH